MATPLPVYWGWSNSPIIDATTHGYKWQLQADRTIDWGIAHGPFGEVWHDPSHVAHHIGVMFEVISYYANVRFNYIGVHATPFAARDAGSEITISLTGVQLFGLSGAWGKAFFPIPNSSTYYNGEAGDVYLNIHSQANFLSATGPGSAWWFLFLHEIGHALGLKHPHDSGGTGRPTFEQIGLGALDEDWATIMSYDDDFNWNLRQWDAGTPMILDVLALQYLYGPNMAVATGHDVYFLAREPYYLAYWDAGGIDTIAASNSQEAWYIELPNTAPSSALTTKVGFAVPRSEFSLSAPRYLAWLAGDYENAAGSSFSDIIKGSDSANQLRGGLGDDSIYGGGGIDTATFSGTPSQYTLQRHSATSVTLRGPDGTDLLVDIERLLIGTTKIAIDIEGNAGKAYRLYQAALDRKPDLPGLGFWIDSLDVGVSLVQASAFFISSEEFVSTYGALGDPDFVTQLYRNILDRDPEPGGYAYWLDLVERDVLTRAEVLMLFSESDENKANVIGQIEHGIVYV